MKYALFLSIIGTSPCSPTQHTLVRLRVDGATEAACLNRVLEQIHASGRCIPWWLTCCFSTAVCAHRASLVFVALGSVAWEDRLSRYNHVHRPIISRGENSCMAVPKSSCEPSKVRYSTRHDDIRPQWLPFHIFKSNGRLRSTCWIMPWRWTDPHTSPSEVGWCN